MYKELQKESFIIEINYKNCLTKHDTKSSFKLI